MFEFEIKRYKRRKEYFENYVKYGKYIKKIAQEFFKENLISVYIFGSVLKKKYSIGLSDIDIAVVLKNTDADLLKFKKIIFDKFKDNPFEVHVVDKKTWENWYKRFVDKYLEV